MQKTILFDPLTAADVKSRIETINRENNYVNGIILTVARMNGAPPNAGVGLNAEGTGVVISVPDETPEFVEAVAERSAPAEANTKGKRPQTNTLDEGEKRM